MGSVKIRQQFLAGLALAATGLQLVGCSFFAGSRQRISLSSQPSGARVVINGEQAGSTPLTYSIPRAEEASILISKEGYEGATRTTSRRLSAVGIVDVVGGCIWLIPFFGLLADGAWQQEPANFSVSLVREEGQAK